MGEFTKKLDNGKWQSIDGKEYATRSGAYKRSKKIEDNKVPSQEVEQEDETNNDTIIDNQQDSSPLWAEQDFTIDLDDDVSEVIPSILKKIKPSVGERRGKKNKKEMEIERNTNKALIKIGYRTGDVMLTKYKRVMMDDPNSNKIEHSETDYEWISDIGVDAMEHNGINISQSIGPNQVFLAANVGWFGVPLYRINKESDKSPFKGKLGGGFGRLLERVPFIGKRIKAKRNPVLVKEVVQDD
tara:strand:+ start:255 stop:980 length:726 start_codon:yes stop_codon:yes gene_type:complete